MLKLTINKEVTLSVGDINKDGYVEIELRDNIYDEEIFVYLNEDEIKQLLDHLTKQISLLYLHYNK